MEDDKVSELINNDSLRRREILKQIIKDLHAGVPVEKLKQTFRQLLQNTTPEEIADMENALINEGFPVSEVQRLCDVHVEVFEDSLKKVGKPSKIPGHPVYTFLQENKEARKLLKVLSRLVKKVTAKNPSEKQLQEFNAVFGHFKEIEKHFLRKENQLFPALEEKQFTGPTKVMWGKHDEIRQFLKQVEAYYREQDWSHFLKEFKNLTSSLKKLLFLEEKILYPTAVRKLSEADWVEIKRGEAEIGYAWIKPSNLWDANLTASRAVQQKIEQIETQGEEPMGKVKLETGELTAEQINLLLKNLPFDVTFVDENDTVRYYSDTPDRIFPRSPGIIGRAVQNCHPPKSVHIVNNIVQSFKNKTKKVADFWIRMGKLLVYIRYFPIYDQSGSYKGVIEVSQEISAIQKLSGEKRLLDWE
jgi:DUF438 domain-containing protein